MSKTSAILLSIALTLLSGGCAYAQYQDPRYGGQDPLYAPAQDPRLAGQMGANDGLDAIYDDINAQAHQKPAGTEKPVRDVSAYNQFMDQTASDLSVEQANTAKLAAARQRDALMTGAYEQKRINDLANWQKSQILGSSPLVRRGRRIYTGPNGAAAYTSNSYYYSGSGIPSYVDARTRNSLLQSQDVTYSRLQDNQALAQRRSQALEDVADNLRDQVLSTQSSTKAFGLQGVGTNLYVRQYGKPEANLPPVHNAAARIVPMGSDDY